MRVGFATMRIVQIQIVKKNKLLSTDSVQMEGQIAEP